MSYQYKEYKNHVSHRWEDISYHGSPSYECIYCQCSERSEAAEKSCLKAEKCLLEIKMEEERKEKFEYQEMKRKKDGNI